MFQNPLGEMVQKYPSAPEFRQQPRARLFHPDNSPSIVYPILHVEIDWERLIAKRPLLLKSIDDMPAYLLKPEVLELLALEKDLMYRLILDVMWSTGARISEVLALTPSSFIDDGDDFNVILKTLKQRPGRPSNASLQRSSKRPVPIKDHMLQEQLLFFLTAGQFKQTQQIFPVTRQNVNRHIHALVEEVGGAPFSISCKTFRHSFAIHLLLHGRPLKVIAKFLGHRSTHSTEIYTNVLTIDGGHFLEGVDFH